MNSFLNHLRLEAPPCSWPRPPRAAPSGPAGWRCSWPGTRCSRPGGCALSLSRMPHSSSRAFGLELEIRAMASVFQLTGFSATFSAPAAATGRRWDCRCAWRFLLNSSCRAATTARASTLAVGDGVGQIIACAGPHVARGEHRRRRRAALGVDHDMPGGVACKRFRQEFRSGRLADIDEHRAGRNGLPLRRRSRRSRTAARRCLRAPTMRPCDVVHVGEAACRRPRRPW